jgi:hypothetical protein
MKGGDEPGCQLCFRKITVFDFIIVSAGGISELVCARAEFSPYVSFESKPLETDDGVQYKGALATTCFPFNIMSYAARSTGPFLNLDSRVKRILHLRLSSLQITSLRSNTVSWCQIWMGSPQLAGLPSLCRPPQHRVSAQRSDRTS